MKRATLRLVASLSLVRVAGMTKKMMMMMMSRVLRVLRGLKASRARGRAPHAAAKPPPPRSLRPCGAALQA
eukprot:248758-Rhodomonas_salina.1